MDQQSQDFWPTLSENIKKWTEGRQQGATKETLGINEVTCCICQEARLVIPGFQPPLSETIATTPQEEGVVLACGHLVGKQCAESWRESCASNGQTYSCPLCRFNLRPPTCKWHELQDMFSLANGPQDLALDSQMIQLELSKVKTYLETIPLCHDCKFTNAHGGRRPFEVIADPWTPLASAGTILDQETADLIHEFETEWEMAAYYINEPAAPSES